MATRRCTLRMSGSGPLSALSSPLASPKTRTVIGKPLSQQLVPVNASSPTARPLKSRSRVAMPESGVAVAAPLAPLGYRDRGAGPLTSPIAGSSSLSVSTLSAMSAPLYAPVSPAGVNLSVHRFVGESRRCLAWVVDAEGPVSALRMEEAWSVPPPAPHEVCSMGRGEGMRDTGSLSTSSLLTPNWAASCNEFNAS